MKWRKDQVCCLFHDRSNATWSLSKPLTTAGLDPGLYEYKTCYILSLKPASEIDIIIRCKGEGALVQVTTFFPLHLKLNILRLKREEEKKDTKMLGEEKSTFLPVLCFKYPSCPFSCSCLKHTILLPLKYKLKLKSQWCSHNREMYKM